MIGYGTIGKCVLDILLLDSKFIKDNIFPDFQSIKLIVVDAKHKSTEPLYKNVQWVIEKLTNKNVKQFFKKLSLNVGDIVIDLTSCTGTKDIVREVCQVYNALYVCTALEGWNGYMYPMHKMVTYVGSLKKKHGKGKSTALLTHGMNPGMVSHFMKKGLQVFTEEEKKMIKNVHITEIDSQKMKNLSDAPVAVHHLTQSRPKMSKNIYSTWGPQNFADEMNAVPIHVKKKRASKNRKRAYKETTPSMIFDPKTKSIQPFNGHIVSHEEVFTMNNFLKQNDYGDNHNVAFIYKPCQQSFDSLVNENNLTGNAIKIKRKGYLIKGPDVEGYDTVGVLITLTNNKAVWVGNSCKAGFAVNEELRKKFHNATTIQVAAGVLSGLFILSKAPNLGVIYPEDVPEELTDMAILFSERYYGPVELLLNF